MPDVRERSLPQFPRCSPVYQYIYYLFSIAGDGSQVIFFRIISITSSGSGGCDDAWTIESPHGILVIPSSSTMLTFLTIALHSRLTNLTSHSASLDGPRSSMLPKPPMKRPVFVSPFFVTITINSGLSCTPTIQSGLQAALYRLAL